MTNACASLAKLAELKLDCDAELIRAIWKAPTREALVEIYPPADDIDRAWCNPARLRILKREAINQAGGYSGVEYIGTDRRQGHGVFYCNAGESYAPTICFIGRRLVVECWAYWVESGRVREGSHYDQ